MMDSIMIHDISNCSWWIYLDATITRIHVKLHSNRIFLSILVFYSCLLSDNSTFYNKSNSSFACNVKRNGQTIWSHQRKISSTSIKLFVPLWLPMCTLCIFFSCVYTNLRFNIGQQWKLFWCALIMWRQI